MSWYCTTCGRWITGDSTVPPYHGHEEFSQALTQVSRRHHDRPIAEALRELIRTHSVETIYGGPAVLVSDLLRLVEATE